MNRPWLRSIDVDSAEAQDAESIDLSLPNILAIVKRRISIIVATVFVGLIASSVYIFQTKPIYSTAAIVLIDPRQPNLIEQQNNSFNYHENLIIDSEIEIIKSSELLKRAAAILKLDSRQLSVKRSLHGQIKDFIYDKLNIHKPAPTNTETPAAPPKNRAYRRLKNGLTVKRVGLTYAIDVNYTSTDREFAARAANAIAETYLVDKLETRLAAAQHTNDWLRERVAKLKADVIQAERSVELYKAQNNIVDTSDGKLVTDQQLTELNSSLIVARADAAGAKAIFDRINSILEAGNTDAAVEGVLSSSVISSLRTEYIRFSRAASRLLESQGPNHLGYINAKAEMDRINRLIFVEIQRVADNYENNYEIAQARVASLEADLQKLMSIHTVSGQKQLRLRELERQANSLRELYNNLLGSLGKSNVQGDTATSKMNESGTRIIEYAEVPGSPVSPNKRLAVLIGLFGGVAIGLGLAYLRETLDSFIWKQADLERILAKRSFGMMPKLRLKLPKHSQRSWQSRAPLLAQLKGNKKRTFDKKRIGAFRAPLSDRFGHVSEILRNILMSTKAAAEQDGMAGAKVIAFLSTLPGEGKSTISALQALYQAQNGAKTLLIDSDFRRPFLTRTLTPSASFDMPSTKADFDLHAFLFHDSDSGLDFLPVFAGERDARPADLILKGELIQIIEKFRDEYDYIIVDLPPILVLPDARLLAEMIDHIVYVVEWGKVKKQAVAEAVNSSAEIRNRVIGSIFNKVELNKLKVYGEENYSNYYYK